MLPRENRLKTKFEYTVAKKYGGYYSGHFFHLYIVKPTNYTGPTKVGIVISNNFHKSAVKRNRVKRLYREAIQKNLALFPQNLWVAIYPKFSSIEKTYEEICTDFDQTLQKVSFTN